MKTILFWPDEMKGNAMVSERLLSTTSGMAAIFFCGNIFCMSRTERFTSVDSAKSSCCLILAKAESKWVKKLENVDFERFTWNNL